MDKTISKNLEIAFNPKSVAVIGASSNPSRVGHSMVESLLYEGFKGNVYPVNPREKEIEGLPVYKDIRDLPEVPDLAIISLNQFATLEAVETCGQLGVKGVLCIAGGFKEMGEEGAELENKLIDTANKYKMALIGPNSLGIINTASALNATFYPMKLGAGNVSVISQSGGLGLSLIHKSMEEGVDICKWVGVGNRSQLEFKDILEYFAVDPATKVITIFLESTEDALGLVELGRKVAKSKPIIVYKSGKSEQAQYAALTHTGSLAGSPKMYMDIFRQNGLITVNSLSELVAAWKALSVSDVPDGDGLGIITHTAGPSIVMIDTVEQYGISFADLQEETYTKVKGVIGENPPIILKNPLDVAGLGFAFGPFGQLTNVLLSDDNIQTVIAVYCQHKNWRFPTAELIAAKEATGKQVIACYISPLEMLQTEIPQLREKGIPVYASIEEAAQGAAALIRYGRILKELGGLDNE